MNAPDSTPRAAAEALPAGGGSQDAERALWRFAADRLGYGSPERARFRCEQTFQGVTIGASEVLEIGAGSGLHSAFAAARGAHRVVALEPEVDGSTGGSRSTLVELQRALRLANLEVSSSTLQAFDAGPRRFDVVLLYNSVNHLDEPACAELHRSEDARDRYRALLRRIAGMMSANGTLIVADCSRVNLWPMLGAKNPFAPWIEWEKHQTPQVWDALLGSEQFAPVSMNWYRYYPLRWLGRASSGAAANFVLGGYFRMVRRYAP